MSKRPGDVTSFGGPNPENGPFVDPRVTDPAALKYQQDAIARAAGNRYSEPRGGQPTPPIPRLDMPHQGNMSMADQAAAAQRQQHPGPLPFPHMSSGGGQTIFEPAQTAAPSITDGILNTDILPEVAKQDPMFQRGSGEMVAINQPHLAKKYGVIRNKTHLMPQQLFKAAPGLSKETIQGLEIAKSFAQKSVEAATGETAAEQAAASGPMGHGAHVGQRSDRNPNPASEEDKAAAAKVLAGMDNFDLHALREATMKDLLNNKEQKEIIEARLAPLSIDDLIMNGYIVQRVPIIPKRFEVTYQSLSSEDEMALKRLVLMEAKALVVSEEYLMDKFGLMAIACSVTMINEQRMLDHHDDDGSFSEDRFLQKFNKMVKYPIHMLASMGVNGFWFDVRVRKLFVAEKLGNG
jgi:hypothetical protein